MLKFIKNTWWKFKETCTVVICLAILLPRPILAQNDNIVWAEKSLEMFEMYCYQTSAEYTQIENMATALKLKPAPEVLLSVGIGTNSKDGKAYLLEWDKEKKIVILLGFSKPEACSIYTQGISYDLVKQRLHTSYKLSLAFRDDVGLQVSEMYVPGGKTGSKREAAEFGIVSVIYTKPDVSIFGFTLGYLPPKTLREHGKAQSVRRQ